MMHHRGYLPAKVRFGAFLLLLAGVLVFSQAPSVLADTFIVDLSADDAAANQCTATLGDCSLRGAITKANAQAGTDRIVLPDRTFDLTLLGTGDDINKTGDLDILASGGSVIIEGAGAGTTIINGGMAAFGPVGGIDRVFHIDPAEEGGIRVDIKGVSIRYGAGQTFGGGILYLGDNRLLIENSEIMSNTVGIGNGLGGGGGIYIRGGTAILDNTDVLTNTAAGTAVGGVVLGGGILAIDNSAVLTLTQSSVSGNRVSVVDGTGSEAGGGGLANFDATAWVHNTVFDRNAATGGGTGSVGLGGGILNASGGNLLLDQGSVVSHNEADLQGGGMASIDSPALVSDTTFTLNAALGGSDGEDSKGGGIYNMLGRVTIINSYLEDNEAMTGGGVANDEGRLNLRETHVVSNLGHQGCGGLLIENLGELDMDSGSLSLNTAGGSGGGACIYDSEADLGGTTVSLNMADSSGGGFTTLGSRLHLIGCMISGNRALTGKGGGFYDAAGQISILDSTLYANRAGQSGGGLYEQTGEASIVRSTFLANVVTDPPATPSDNEGGGMYLSNSTADAVNTTFSGNLADESGGGIYCDSNSSITLTHVTITANVADEDDDDNALGGGLYDEGGGTSAIKNTIIAGNSARGGPAPDCAGAFLTAGRNIVWDASGCSFTGPGPLTGVDPLLDAIHDNGGPTETHALLVGSPAVDNAVDCTSYHGDGMRTDQRKVSRPVGDECDIGAFEGWLTRIFLPVILRPL